MCFELFARGGNWPQTTVTKLRGSAQDTVFAKPEALTFLQVELSCRVAVLLVRLHHRQIVATPSVRTTIAEVKELLHKQIKRKKDVMGFNLAGVCQMLAIVRKQKNVA